MKLLLVDLSSLFRPIWEMSGKEADQDYASKTTVARVHEMAHGYDGVAVCCDSRKSWRKELAPTYKANRPPSEEPMIHQLRLAQDALKDDGFPVWQAEGFEADDVCASAVRYATEWFRLTRDQEDDTGGSSVIIASSDKDLLQLVSDWVGVKSLRTGDVMGPAEVEAKLGVRPDQVRDWLCMVGDSSDNVEGIKGIGAKRATELLQKHGTLANIYATIGDSCTTLGLTPSMFTNLKEGMMAAELARKLITLRTDVELPFADIFKPRTPKQELVELEDTMAQVIDNDTGEVTQTPEPQQVKPWPKPDSTLVDTPREIAERMSEHKPTTQLATLPAEWSKGLEPANLSQAMTLAKAIHASRLFQAYGSPEAVLTAILTGREFGMTTMAALRSIHIVEGKPTLSAALMAALVLRSPTCKQFEIVERTNERATIRIWREGWEEPKDISYSLDDARRAGRLKESKQSDDGKDRRSMWEKDPAAMCLKTCQAIGARLGWPDLLANVYDRDELEEQRGAA